MCLALAGDAADGLRPLGGAARWWLHGALTDLGDSLKRLDCGLIILPGPAQKAIDMAVTATGASANFWNRRYGAVEIALDSALRKRLTDCRLKVQSFPGRLLNEPWQEMNQAGKPFQIFTPYLRAVMAWSVDTPLLAPNTNPGGRSPYAVLDRSVQLDDLGLKPVKPDWATEFATAWRPGAQERLRLFLETGLPGYAEGRDMPAKEAASRLSPHLRFGEISPRQVWHVVGNLWQSDLNSLTTRRNS